MSAHAQVFERASQLNQPGRLVVKFDELQILGTIDARNRFRWRIRVKIQVRAGQMRALQVGAPQVRARHVRVVQVRASQVRAL